MIAIGKRILAVIRFWPEVAMACSYVGGWALLTWGIGRLLVPEVWLISGGLFLLSLVLVTLGIGPLRLIVRDGMYSMFRGLK